MKLLKNIISVLKDARVYGDPGVMLSNISMDSRTVKQQGMFIAVKGENTDGHNFISQAIENGASAVVCEKLPVSRPENATWITVPNSSYALGIIASAFYDYPTEYLKLVGITGTNGKTTVATLLFELFRSLGYKTGLISTVSYNINETVIPASHTTPDQITLNKLFYEMRNQGCSHCFMEVSSHSVVQNRIAGIKFDGGVFTNITPEHLDYHKDFKSYINAKKLFFDNLPASAFALSNADDPNGVVMLQNTKARKLFYSLYRVADFKGAVIESTIKGLYMRIKNNDIYFRLSGRFNAYNLLAVFAVSTLLQIDDKKTLTAMSKLNPVNGRFQFIDNKKNIHCLVDYAHTPDAVKNALKSINEVRSRNETLIVVLGAGGNRDKNKRPVMASIAAEYADKLILTSDNPRYENPDAILEDMKKGLNARQLKKTLIISDRAEAIKTACMLALPNDIIIVAGKGHETYQEINGVKYPFDDKKILDELLNKE